MKDIKIKDTVFIKKSSRKFTDIPLTVKSVFRKKRNSPTVYAELSNNMIVKISDLTAIPCHIMTCANCIYHPQRKG